MTCHCCGMNNPRLNMTIIITRTYPNPVWRSIRHASVLTQPFVENYYARLGAVRTEYRGCACIVCISGGGDLPSLDDGRTCEGSVCVVCVV